MAQALQPSLVELWYSGLGGGQLVGIATSLSEGGFTTTVRKAEDSIDSGVNQPIGWAMPPMPYAARVAAGEGMPGIQG